MIKIIRNFIHLSKRDQVFNIRTIILMLSLQFLPSLGICSSPYADIFTSFIYDQTQVLSKYSPQIKDNKIDDEKIIEELLTNLNKNKREQLDEKSLGDIRKKIIALSLQYDDAQQREYWENILKDFTQLSHSLGNVVGMASGFYFDFSTGFLIGQLGGVVSGIATFPFKLLAENEVRKLFPKKGDADSIWKEMSELNEKIIKLYKELESEPIRKYEIKYVKVKYSLFKNSLAGLNRDPKFFEEVEKELINARKNPYNISSIMNFLDIALSLPTCIKPLLNPKDPLNSLQMLRTKFYQDERFEVYEDTTKNKLWDLVHTTAQASIDRNEESEVPSRLRVFIHGEPGCGKSQAGKNIADFLKVPMREMTIHDSQEFSKVNIYGSDRVIQNGTPGWIFEPLLTRLPGTGETFQNSFLIINDIHTILRSTNSPAYMFLLDILDDNISSVSSPYFKFLTEIKHLNLIFTSNIDIPPNDAVNNYDALRGRRIKSIHFQPFNMNQKERLRAQYLSDCKRRSLIPDELTVTYDPHSNKYIATYGSTVLAEETLPMNFNNKLFSEQKIILSSLFNNLLEKLLNSRQQWYDNAVNLSDVEAIQWYLPAALLDHANSSLALAKIYERQNNLSEAKKWHIRAMQLSLATDSIAWLVNHWNTASNKEEAFDELAPSVRAIANFPVTNISLANLLYNFAVKFFEVKKFDKAFEAHQLATSLDHQTSTQSLTIKCTSLNQTDMQFFQQNIWQLRHLNNLDLSDNNLQGIGFLLLNIINRNLSQLQTLNLLRTQIATATNRSENVKIIEALGSNDHLVAIQLDSIILNNERLSEQQSNSLLKVLDKTSDLTNLSIDRALTKQEEIRDVLELIKQKNHATLKILSLLSLWAAINSALPSLVNCIDSCTSLEELHLGGCVDKNNFSASLKNALISRKNTLRSLSFEGSDFSSNLMENYLYSEEFKFSDVRNRLIDTISQLSNLTWLCLYKNQMEFETTEMLAEVLSTHVSLKTLYFDMAHAATNSSQGFKKGKDLGLAIGGGGGTVIGFLGGGPAGAFLLGSILGGASILTGEALGALTGSVLDYFHHISTKAASIALHLGNIQNLEQLHLCRVGSEPIFKEIIKIINRTLESNGRNKLTSSEWVKSEPMPVLKWLVRGCPDSCNI